MHAAWTAVVFVTDSNHGVELHAEVCVSSLRYKEEYEQLLDAIRYFAAIHKRNMARSHGVIHIRCTGISDFIDSAPLPVFPHASGNNLVDAKFTEPC